MTPEQLAACLNLVASRIDSSKVPSRTAVASDIRAIVAMMDSDGAHFAGLWNSFLRTGKPPGDSKLKYSDWESAWDIFSSHKTNSVYPSLDHFKTVINQEIKNGNIDRFLTNNNIPIGDVEEMKRLLKVKTAPVKTAPTDNDWVEAWGIFKETSKHKVSDLNSFKEAINQAIENGNIDTYLTDIKNANRIKTCLKIKP